MGRINKRALLGRLQRIGQASRADLAKSLGLSQPTAGKIAEELLRLGILEEIDDEAGAQRGTGRGRDGKARVGRPGRLMRLQRAEARFLAIQLGVSRTNLAALPAGVDAEDQWSVQFGTPRVAEAWVRQLKIAATKIPQNEFWGVLVSVPGIVDEPNGRVVFSPNLHWTESADLISLVQQVWPAPVQLVQEERALALGHQCFDSQDQDFLLVEFGEGVGGAAIVAGKLYTSALPLNCELGHTPVLGNRRPCGCGATGCIETLVSRRGLLESFAGDRPRGQATWRQFCLSLHAQVLPGWLAETLDATGMVIAGTLNVLGLHRVIITGTLTPSVLDHLSRAIVGGAMWARFGNVEVESAPRRRAAGLVAVGIDRLVLPMEETLNQTGQSPAALTASQGGGGWPGYNK